VKRGQSLEPSDQAGVATYHPLGAMIQTIFHHALTFFLGEQKTLNQGDCARCAIGGGKVLL